MLRRHSSIQKRRARQARTLGVPLLPTTTIGSFPQTATIRRARAARRAGQLSNDEYDSIIGAEIAQTIAFQQETGLDVLVHGEFERSDMVEYFSSGLTGFASTENGWVQSYGSRCIKPPILFGNVTRPAPISVGWARYAQSLAPAPVKAIITGPVTMLKWSFVREDISRQQIARQLALALREEVKDLESAGIRIIQVDEPAFREGLPLHRKDRSEYLRWAVDAFRVTTSVVSDETQIHTHMCYSDFQDILPAIRKMDADVVSIETARSDMELVHKINPAAFRSAISVGVYDIHSPRVPTVAEFENLIHTALQVLDPEQLWISPDCGLKTRRWAEVGPALRNMVIATRRIRSELTRNQSDTSALPVPSPGVSNWEYYACNCT
jgi:5-methyltetrahydropteroyltriglutamate--homocysteine methyltransferase